ncbi:MAG TPA: c-type cytochrome [bacterium]|jgi:mono/diheme cytochrome c family protein
MSIRILSLLAVVIAGSLLVSACQPTVGVTRAIGDHRLDLAQAEPSVVPVHPSAAAGKQVFQKAQCVVCHGPEGLGNGPAAGGLKSSGKSLLTDFLRLLGIDIEGEQLPSRPANFHNTVQMRLNSPFSMYETVTRGRPHTAMPSFGPRPAYGANTFGVKLTDEERWHVIFYEFAFSTTPREVAKGKQIYDALQVQVVAGGESQPLTCASCHGDRGDGRGRMGAALRAKLWGWARGQGPGIFTDINLMAQRKPTELFQSIMDGRGEMPGYRGKLTEDQVWAVVNYIWTFVYEYSGKP